MCFIAFLQKNRSCMSEMSNSWLQINITLSTCLMHVNKNNVFLLLGFFYLFSRRLSEIQIWTEILHNKKFAWIITKTHLHPRKWEIIWSWISKKRKTKKKTPNTPPQKAHSEKKKGYSLPLLETSLNFQTVTRGPPQKDMLLASGIPHPLSVHALDHDLKLGRAAPWPRAGTCAPRPQKQLLALLRTTGKNHSFLALTRRSILVILIY